MIRSVYLRYQVIRIQWEAVGSKQLKKVSKENYTRQDMLLKVLTKCTEPTMTKRLLQQQG